MGIATSMFEINKSTLVEQLQSLVRTIVAAMVEFKKLKQFKSEGIRHYQWDALKQKIRIEDILQIFVDDIGQMKDFLQHVIETYGNENFEKYLKELTSLNLYHRLLECYLYMNQNN